jgi:adenylate cyclase
VNETRIPADKMIMIKSGDAIMIGSLKMKYFDGPELNAPKEEPLSAKKRNMVTILPSEEEALDNIAIKAEIDADEDSNIDFKRADQLDINTLKEDYEKLRLAYELSKVALTNDVNVHLEKSLDLIFEMLPVDIAVVLLVDHNTGTLATQHIKIRHENSLEEMEIALSSTILKRVYDSRKCLVTMDASSAIASESVLRAGTKMVICLPLLAHHKVHGILHLAANQVISNITSKDLSIVKAIGNQTAIAIENSVLMVQQEANARVNEQLSRFLPPHVVEKMTDRSDIIKGGGRMLYGTILFCDIRGFTNLSERSTPVEVVNLLNDFFERVSLTNISW